MARRAKSASAIAEPRTKATVRAHLDIHQLAGITGEIVNSYRLWRARPRPDAVGLILDAIVSFEAIVNPQGLTFDGWRAGGSVDYRGSRVVGVAVCSVVEVYFEILERLGLTGVIGGDSIIEGTLDAERLRGVEASIDSLARLAEILRTAAVSGDVSPVEIPSEELIGQCDKYTDLEHFAKAELRGQEREFLLLMVESMRQEPNVGLRFATIAQRYRHPDFDCVSYCKNKLHKLKVKINQSGLQYKLRQHANAAVIEFFSSK
jgi:hypothetical protein